MKTKTSVKQGKNVEQLKGKARMVMSDYSLTLEDVPYTITESIAGFLKAQADLFRKTAEEAKDNAVIDACDQLSRHFRKLHKAFDIQGLINENLLFTDRSYSQD